MYTSLKSGTYPVADLPGLKKKVLNWLRSFNTFCFLDNHLYQMEPHTYDCLVAAGEREFIEGDDIRTADAFLKEARWAFGHLSYGLKDSIYNVPTIKKTDLIGFPPFYFFCPQVVLQIKGDLLTVHARNPAEIYTIVMQQPDSIAPEVAYAAPVTSVLTKEAYVDKIKSLQAHILRGDCYEVNFCQEFFATRAVIEPFSLFQKLMEVSPNPFSAFYRLKNRYVLCASPERFLAKKGERLVTQPIKGTVRRDLSNALQDRVLKESLVTSVKEKAENVMVVDLVRNDLTKVCVPGTVQVDELFGIYSFPQVHQMISTVSGEIKVDCTFSSIIEATFPMGSMTGAPKHRVLKLIDEYEPSARGLFSGSIGYKAPYGDFDFNVVIRSLLYNASNGYLSYQVGSGITFYCDPEKEWEECMLKAEAIKKVLAGEAK